MTAVNGSFLEQAKREREALTKQREHDFSLPGYSVFKVRYRALTYSEVIDLEAKAPGTATDSQMVRAAEGVLMACQTLLVKEADEWVPWLDSSGSPMQFDERLVTELEIELPPNPQPRDVVYEFFGGLPEAGLALMTHWLKYSDWVDDFQSEVTKEHLKN
jgi:hypothetical protein